MKKPPARPHQPGSPAPGSDHDPSPVDIASESVAGEEDPGASVEPPAQEVPDRNGAPRPLPKAP
jgi:hypothetical protein